MKPPLVTPYIDLGQLNLQKVYNTFMNYKVDINQLFTPIVDNNKLKTTCL